MVISPVDVRSKFQVRRYAALTHPTKFAGSDRVWRKLVSAAGEDGSYQEKAKHDKIEVKKSVR
jgi:hypothetical protein